jgi:A-macroglobulin receptor binding domain
MMIAEIGIPPGVDVDREGLQKQMSENGWDLSSFDVLPDRIVAYVWPRADGTKFALSFTARMAVDAQAAPHTLFDYYNPDASVTIAPDRFTVVEPALAAAR